MTRILIKLSKLNASALHRRPSRTRTKGRVKVAQTNQRDELYLHHFGDVREDGGNALHDEMPAVEHLVLVILKVGEGHRHR